MHGAAPGMRIPPARLSMIIAGKRGISAGTARRPARLFGPGVRFWMNPQTRPDPAGAGREHGEKIARVAA